MPVTTNFFKRRRLHSDAKYLKAVASRVWLLCVGESRNRGVKESWSQGVRTLWDIILCPRKLLTMYRPNFCADCGARIVRLRWYPWTSRRFCAPCSRRFVTQRLKPPLVAALVVFGLGFLLGRAGRPPQPPLVIERSANSPLYQTQTDNAVTEPSTARANPGVNSKAEKIYICGARTRKGTPCSRRVHGPERCWQHKGMPAMQPQDKLLIKD
jgi:hypothetical protein